MAGFPGGYSKEKIMAKMWAGRTSGETNQIADDFNASISVDKRMYREDITGSMAHAAMLAKQGILTKEEADVIIDGLSGILSDLDSGALIIGTEDEDIHMFVERILTERTGAYGKKLHTARSRNDQVALDIRMYLRNVCDEDIELLKELCAAITDKAEEYEKAVMPGYTHLQRAQPILFAHQLLAYAQMFLRDIGRLSDCRKRMNVSPIGSCALAGTTYDTDRRFEAEKLSFDDIAQNSIDGVSDRDFCVEYLNAAATIMMHLSRFSEELVLWSSCEFGFITIDDAFTTGSSIMPQKKNPDMAELCRGKTGRVYGDLIALLTVLKGLPLAYNKDMQEDKEPVFDAVDTVKNCLLVFTPMLATIKVHEDRMMEAAKGGFINATDLADYLVGKGVPFRDAYKVSGRAVALCIEKALTLESLPLSEYKELDAHIDDDVYGFIDLYTCVVKRISEGGTGPDSVKKQIEWVRNKISL